MDQRQFVFTDVFTSNPFEGNQLAVFPDGVGLTAAQMQTLAREIQRPSLLRIEVESDGREIRGVRVGGHARIVGNTRMNVPLAG